jgi:hypothetical protein
MLTSNALLIGIEQLSFWLLCLSKLRCSFLPLDFALRFSIEVLAPEIFQRHKTRIASICTLVDRSFSIVSNVGLLTHATFW